MTLLHNLHEAEHCAERIVHLAATIVSDLGSLTLFTSPRQLMGYSDLGASKHSSSGKVQRGPITGSGNTHLRRVPVEASGSSHHRPNVMGFLLRWQKNLALSQEVKAIA